MTPPDSGFQFKIEVLGLTGRIDDDVRFTEVGGLSLEIATEVAPERGARCIVQRYPLHTRYPDLVLRRGVLKSSAIRDWSLACIEKHAIAPRRVDVKLLGEDHAALITWHLIGAYPVKWALADVDSSSDSILVESLQLAYQCFTLDAG
jgi:phage tail-like protein